MSIDKLASEALRLNSHDRAILAEIIWESLEDPYLSSSDISDREAVELSLKRNKELEQGIVKPLNHQDLMSRLRNEG